MKITKETLSNYLGIEFTISALEAEINELEEEKNEILPDDEKLEQAETIFQIIANNIDEFFEKFDVYELENMLNNLYFDGFEKIDPLIEKNENAKRLLEKIGLDKKTRNNFKKRREEGIERFEGKSLDEIKKAAQTLKGNT